MSAVFEDNFELYGLDIAGRDKMLQGVWAAFSGTGNNTPRPLIPGFELDGRPWLFVPGSTFSSSRAVFPGGAIGDCGVAYQMRCQTLPGNFNTRICTLLDNTNAQVLELRLDPTGIISLLNNAGNVVAATTVPVILADTTHKIQFQATFGNPSGAFELRVDGVTRINATGLNLPGSPAQVGFRQIQTGVSSQEYWVKWFAVYSLTGTYNDDWPAISDVQTLMIDADTATDNFTPRPIQLYGAANLAFPWSSGQQPVLDCGDSADYDLGSATYTVEGWFRWAVGTVPSGAAYDQLFGVWAEASNNRSYRLRLCGEAVVGGGGLKFEISTDGTTGTAEVIHDVNWTPEVGRWYHIAVCRDGSNDNRLFIDGVAQGLPKADANTYNATGVGVGLWFGAQQDFGSATINGNSGFAGWMDEIRLTPGVARYTSNFTPPSSAFPRAAPADPNFADVDLLAGFDNSIVDESGASQTLTARHGAYRLVASDAAATYLSADQRSPNDENFIEADRLPAKGILTMTGNALDTETVTIGSQAYTFVTALSTGPTVPFEVLVGADAQESLEHLTNAINNGPGEGTEYSTGTTVNTDVTGENDTPTTDQMTVTANLPGTAGNSVATTETLTNGSWGAATLTGGTNVPGPSEFSMQPLASTVTGVRWLGIRYRGEVSNGAATLQASLDVNGSEADGNANAVSPGFTNYQDRFEEDPNSSSAMTPSTVTDGLLKINRTT